MHTRPRPHTLSHAARLALSALTLAVVALIAPAHAAAFCGFYVSGASGDLYNDATQVILMRSGMRTVLTMQNSYQGPTEDFAMVVPVPVVLQEENVKTLSPEIFARLDRMAAPRLVEYWERDPCYDPPDPPSSGGWLGIGCGAMAMPKAMAGSAAPPDRWVEVRAEFAVGEYEIVILESNDASTLFTWLTDRKYNVPKGADAVLAPYIEQGMYFFVAKVNTQKVRFDGNTARLSPLRFHYDSDTFSLPIRLGMLNAKGDQDLIVHILAQNQRYEVANVTNTTIPTNIDVTPETKQNFGAFYNALFDRVARDAQGRPQAVTEYAWQATKCDPCPGPQLVPADFSVLGSDVLGGANPMGLVLTRIHMRYGPNDKADDLTFRPADPIVGGREVYGAQPQGPPGLERGATKAQFNNFQARYAIRYPWTGEIGCWSPRRGVWTGPNGRGRGQTQGQTGADLAQAPRAVQGGDLASFLRSDVVELGLTAKETTDGLIYGVPDAPPAPEGRGCATAPGHNSPLPGALVVVGLLVWSARRRRS